MASALRAQWDVLVGRAWPVWGAAILVATVNVFLFAFDRPWTASDGLRNWGDWALTGAGILHRPDLLPPWLYSGSLLNLGVLLGGAAAALCAREFAIRVPARGELIKGAAGGALMGVGATLAFGCNIGGFFSAVSALSLAGFAMMVGLGVGAFLGLRYLLWETAHRPGWSSGRGRTWARAHRDASRQPLVGVLLLLLLVAAPFVYAAAGHPQRGIFLLFGAGFGVIFQRSRFCLVRAFREPFLTGDAEHTRAAALALVVSTLGFAILKATDLKDRTEWVFPAAGVVALGASLVRLAASQTGLLGKLGAAVFLPASLGWAGALVLIVAVALGWAMLATWNEATGRLSAA